MITLPLNHVRAVSYAMAVKDVRYYLQGMCVQYNGIQTRVIATNGHRVHIVVTDHAHAEHIKPIQFIVPSDVVKTLLKFKSKQHKTPFVEFALLADGKVSATLPDGMTLNFAPVDGQYPDITRIIPQGELVSSAGNFNWQYLQDAVDGFSDYMARECSPHIMQRGKDSAVLSYEGFTAIVMPMRTDACELTVDSRLYAPIATPTPTTAETVAA